MQRPCLEPKMHNNLAILRYEDEGLEFIFSTEDTIENKNYLSKVVISNTTKFTSNPV